MGIFSTKKKQKQKNKKTKKLKHFVKNNDCKSELSSPSNNVDAASPSGADEDEHDWGSLAHTPAMKKQPTRFCDNYDCSSPLHESESKNVVTRDDNEFSTPIAPKKSKMKILRKNIFSSKKKKRKDTLTSCTREQERRNLLNYRNLRSIKKMRKKFNRKNIPNQLDSSFEQRNDNEEINKLRAGERDLGNISSSDETETISNRNKFKSPSKSILKTYTSYSSNNQDQFVTPKVKSEDKPNVRFEDDTEYAFKTPNVNDAKKDVTSFEDEETSDEEDNASDNTGNESNFNRKEETENFSKQVQYSKPLQSEFYSPRTFQNGDFHQIGSPDGGICSQKSVHNFFKATRHVFTSNIATAVRKKMADCIAPSVPESPYTSYNTDLRSELDTMKKAHSSSFLCDKNHNLQSGPITRNSNLNLMQVSNSIDKSADVSAPKKNMVDRPKLKRLDHSQVQFSKDFVGPNHSFQRKENLYEKESEGKEISIFSGSEFIGAPKKRKEFAESFYGTSKLVKDDRMFHNVEDVHGLTPTTSRSSIHDSSQVFDANLFSAREDFNAQQQQSLSKQSQSDYRHTRKKSNEIKPKCYDSDSDEDASENIKHKNEGVNQDSYLEDSFTTPSPRQRSASTFASSRSRNRSTRSSRSARVEDLSESMSQVTVSTVSAISDVSRLLGSAVKHDLVTEENTPPKQSRQNVYYNASGTKLDPDRARYFAYIDAEGDSDGDASEQGQELQLLDDTNYESTLDEINSIDDYSTPSRSRYSENIPVSQKSARHRVRHRDQDRIDDEDTLSMSLDRSRSTSFHSMSQTTISTLSCR